MCFYIICTAYALRADVTARHDDHVVELSSFALRLVFVEQFASRRQSSAAGRPRRQLRLRLPRPPRYAPSLPLNPHRPASYTLSTTSHSRCTRKLRRFRVMVRIEVTLVLGLGLVLGFEFMNDFRRRNFLTVHFRNMLPGSRMAA